MILPAQTIRKLKPILPFHERTVHNGMSFGLSHAGYDVRIAETIMLWPGPSVLASTIEEFFMPDDLVAFVHDKSSWARKGLSLFNTVIEPGWQGFLTLELVNHSSGALHIEAGSPIAQIVFMRLEQPTETPYTGKYQNQKRGPQEARDERKWKLNEDGYRYIVSRDEYPEIFMLRRKMMTFNAIGKLYGVSGCQIRQILAKHQRNRSTKVFSYLKLRAKRREQNATTT